MPRRPTSSTNVTAEDFYRAFAVAMLRWQAVEHALLIFFYSLFPQSGLQQLSAIYYLQGSFGAKLRLVDATTKVVLGKQQLRLWGDLKKKLRAAAEDRNVLAHHTAVADFKQDDSISLALAPALMVPHAMKIKRSKKYDTAECQRLGEHFAELANSLEKHAEIMVHARS